MSEVVAIVEGQTEQTFVRDHLAAHLAPRGVTIWPVLSGRSRRHGGVRKWESAKGDILKALREGRYVTTMFDFYALPNDWPGRVEAGRLDYGQRGDHVEQAIAETLAREFGSGFDCRQLIPYIQVHEFETLLFSDPVKMAEALTSISRTPRLCDVFRSILVSAGQAEAINDGYETCPSRRIMKAVPAYRKPLYGAIIAGRIGLETLRAACPHFGRWLERLEALTEP